MIIRMKSGEFKLGETSTLLEFLGVRKEAAGAQKVSCNVELIASVPFLCAADVEAGQKTMSNEQLAMSNEKRQEGFEWVLSSFNLDRYGERIDPAGWDIRAYLDNPVVEWSHRYDIPAIGKIDGLHADDNGLHGVVFFNDKSFDPYGWSIGQRVKAGVLRAGSVGFRPLEVEIPSKEDGKDGTTLIFRKQELLEFSICNVPANPFALSKSMSNEQLAMSNERSDNTTNFLSCFINNL